MLLNHVDRSRAYKVQEVDNAAWLNAVGIYALRVAWEGNEWRFTPDVRWVSRSTRYA
jgi:hypothetical protein